MKNPGQLQSLWDMLQLPIGELLSSAQHLATTSQFFKTQNQGHRSTALSPEDYSSTEQNLERFIENCGTAGLVVSADIAARLLELWRKAPTLPNGHRAFHYETYFSRDVEESFGILRGALRSEAKTKVAMVLRSEEMDLFEAQAPLFGDTVAAKFPSLQDEINEAAKCLALGRSTATAFHLLRCLEGGIAAISRCLAIPDPTRGAERNWNSTLAKIKTAIDGRWVGAASRFGGDGATFEVLHAVLVALQNPYRNATMHLDQWYTEEQARHLLEMVKGVMQKIASRMDEAGQPPC